MPGSFDVCMKYWDNATVGENEKEYGLKEDRA